MAPLQIKTVNGQLLVPARWLVLVLGTAVSCVGACLYVVFSIGSFTTETANAQRVSSERISALENYNQKDQDERKTTRKEIFERLTAVETSNKGTEKALLGLSEQQKVLIQLVMNSRK